MGHSWHSGVGLAALALLDPALAETQTAPAGAQPPAAADDAQASSDGAMHAGDRRNRKPHPRLRRRRGAASRCHRRAASLICVACPVTSGRVNKMPKLVLLANKKPELSQEEFRRHYRTAHAPLAASLLRGLQRYVRNFVVEELSGPIGFDVMTEFWFEGSGSWNELRSNFLDDDIIAKLTEDELRFFDRDSMRLFIVEEEETPPGELLGNR